MLIHSDIGPAYPTLAPSAAPSSAPLRHTDCHSGCIILNYRPAYITQTLLWNYFTLPTNFRLRFDVSGVIFPSAQPAEVLHLIALRDIAAEPGEASLLDFVLKGADSSTATYAGEHETAGPGMIANYTIEWTTYIVTCAFGQLSVITADMNATEPALISNMVNTTDRTYAMYLSGPGNATRNEYTKIKRMTIEGTLFLFFEHICLRYY